MTPTHLVAALLLASLAAPPRRAHHALAWDPSRQRVILIAGSTPLDGGQRFVFYSDLWAFDGERWTAIPAAGEQLSGPRLAFDTKRGRMLSFGGYTGRAIGDLRVLERDGWRTIGRLDAMPAAEPGFVYDARRDRFVAFGGSGAPGQANTSTWEWDGAAWTEVPGANPPSRQAHAMVYDARRGRTVVFGGMGSAPPGPPPQPGQPRQPPPTLGDLWEYDGRAWTERAARGAPPPRHSPGAAYDTKRGRTIIFGGLGATGFLGDTWAWDGSAWTKLADAGPPPRAMGHLAYDERRDRVVLFGGRNGWPDGDRNDTWEFDGTAWREVRHP